MNKIKALEKQNNILSFKITLAMIIFAVQLYAMAMSVRYYMAGESTALWPAALFSILLLVVSISVAIFDRKHKEA